MKGVIIKLEGRVQGIGFRRLIKKYCDKNEIFGTVRNDSDGFVEVIAQGDRKKIKEMLSWLAGNPGLSDIRECEYSWRELEKNYSDFMIIHNYSFIKEQTRNFINLGKSFLGKSIPIHVAIIPDGNRRWAKEKGLAESQGHYKAGGYENISSLIKGAEKLGIKYLSIWGFSTENWKRNKLEIKAIFDLIVGDIEKFKKDSQKNKIKFIHIGRKDRLPKKLRDKLEELENLTRKNKGITVQLCLDYGGRDEIVRAVNNAIRKGKNEIDEKDIESNLDSNGAPEPDLIIRTSGEQRLSGFMPWQSVYSELYFTDKYFPDFNVDDLKEAVEEFSRRKRRFGK